MRLHKTGHPIADKISDLIGDLPDGNYKIAYGILRHNIFDNAAHWFEVDKGFWGASHYDGAYRLSYMGTQPKFDPTYPYNDVSEISLEPWRVTNGYTLIVPPTEHVCKFYNIDYPKWIIDAVRRAKAPKIRLKGNKEQVDWDNVGNVITYNSTLGIEAIRRGIPTVSDVNSSVGSFLAQIKVVDDYDRKPLFSFLSAHQFKLSEKDKICQLIEHYLKSS